MKKILSSIIAASLALSSFGMTSYAAGNADADTGVAQIGDEYYETLADAFADAEKGDEIDLIADVKLTEGITVMDANILGDITLDGNDNTITLALGDDGIGFRFGEWCTGVKINNLNIDGKAKWALYFTGGEYTWLTNVTVDGDFDTDYGAVIFYGTNGGILENCDICSGFTNGQGKFPMTLTNSSFGSLIVNGAADGTPAKLFMDEASSIDFVHCGGSSSAMIDPDALQYITTIKGEGPAPDYASIPFAAKTEKVYYLELADAIAELGEDGGKITLLENAELTDYTTITDVDIDLNGKTLTLGAELSIKGDCEIYGGTVKAAEGIDLPDGLFRVGYHSTPEVNNLTMTDATVIAENVKVSTGVFYLDDGCSVTLDNVDVTAAGTQEDDIVGVFYRGSGLGGDVTLTNGTTITTEKVNAVFYRVNLDIEDTTITCENNYKPVFRGAEGTIADTTVTVTGALVDGDGDNHALVQALDSTSIAFTNGTTVAVDLATPVVDAGSTISVYVDETSSLPESEEVKAIAATVNGTPYASVTDAAAAAVSGDELVINANLQDLATVVNGGNALSGVTVKLGADIDLAGIEWTPIGTSANRFKGKFDGQNHTISNLTMTNGDYEGAGLFGFVNGNGMDEKDSADICNVTLKDVNITNLPASGGRTGALVGNAFTTFIDNVHVTGTINAAKWTGGIVGNTYTLIKNSSFIGDVTSTNQSGGIAGAGDVRAYNCYVKGDITAEYWAGGIVGNGQEGTTIVNCYVEGNVYANSCWYYGVGGIAGVAGHGYEGAAVENNYFNGEVYLAGEKIDTPVIGFINADSNDDINSTVGGNSWNTEKYPADLEVIITADVQQSGTASEYKDKTVPAETQERNNNLVMLESDLAYVDALNSDEVTVMDFSDITEDEIEEAVFANVVAVIGDERFATFDEAYEAATDGDVIDLVGSTIIVTEKKIEKTLTIKNGTISMNPEVVAFDLTTPVRVWTVAAGKTLTLKNVTLIGNGYNTSNRAVIYLAAGANVEFIDSTVDLRNDNPKGGFIKANNTGTGTVATFSNTDVYLENTGRGIQNIDTVTITDSNFVIKSTTDTGIENAFNKVGLVLNGNSVVEIDGCTEYGVKMEQDISVNDTAMLIVRNSGISDIMVRTDGATATLNVAAGAKVLADLIETDVLVAGDGEVVSSASIVYVQFKELADEDEEAITYDIVIAGNGKTINRLTTADLTFAFSSENAKNSDMYYEVYAKDGVNLTPKGENRYMFNFDGITNPDETGETITIGQVKVTGFGKFNLGISESDVAKATNIVNATEVEDNLVDTFTIVPAEDEGTLIVNVDKDTGDDMVGNIAAGEITIPQRTLTINVAFPNKVDYNNAAYQDMSITISGGQYNETIALGDEDKSAGGYSIERTLDYNTTYMVTVAGSGYRTARYSVVMTEDKTLNFWNNVKSAHNAMEIEEGVSGLTTKNFLAGDIVKDNTINIWDLNAVVSFFGTVGIKDMAAEDADRYVRYDLNRDGKIDSKDVAYVLVSWGE